MAMHGYEKNRKRDKLTRYAKTTLGVALPGAVGDTLLNQKGSLLGQAVDISKRYMHGDDDQDPPTEGGGGAGPVPGGSEGGNVMEFVMANKFLLTALAMALIMWGLSAASRRTASGTA